MNTDKEKIIIEVTKSQLLDLYSCVAIGRSQLKIYRNENPDKDLLELRNLLRKYLL